MNERIIGFYITANKLKNVIRTGWKEVGISSERLESIAEHVYGSIILAIGLESECELDIDMAKVMKMLTLKELFKVALKETTTRDANQDVRANARKTIESMTSELSKCDEIMSLIDECEKNVSKEAKFVNQVSTIESDLQAKIYDLNGEFDIDKAHEDAKYYGEELSNEIIPQIEHASDGWILYDRKHYEDDIFKSLSQAIQDIENL